MQVWAPIVNPITFQLRQYVEDSEKGVVLKYKIILLLLLLILFIARFGLYFRSMQASTFYIGKIPN